MSVGNGDTRATRGGAVIIVGAILSAVFAMVMHAIRVHGSSTDQTTRACISVGWTFLAVLLTLATFVLELSFGIAYPYLERERVVMIVETSADDGI